MASKSDSCCRSNWILNDAQMWVIPSAHRQKTKWGSCNAAARRVWFNLELAKQPVQCLEYIVVHELVHLLERHHDERFMALMETHLPQWRQYRQMLSRTPLGHEDWDY